MDHDSSAPKSEVLASVRRHRIDGVVVLSVSGEVDLANAPSLRAHLKAAIETAENLVVVNLKDLKYIDSSGIKALLDAHGTFAPRGRSIVLAAVSPMVQRVWEILRLEQVIPVFPTVATAVESFHRDNGAAGR